MNESLYICIKSWVSNEKLLTKLFSTTKPNLIIMFLEIESSQEDQHRLVFTHRYAPINHVMLYLLFLLLLLNVSCARTTQICKKKKILQPSYLFLLSVSCSGKGYLYCRPSLDKTPYFNVFFQVLSGFFTHNHVNVPHYLRFSIPRPVNQPDSQVWTLPIFSV